MKEGGKHEFSTFDVMKVLDIKRERLREWMNQRFITATAPAEGVGTKAIFSILDIYKIAVFKKLIEAGMNRRRASDLVNTNPRINSPEDVEELTYIIVFEVKTGARWESYLEPAWKMDENLRKYTDWDIGIIINFERIRNQIKARAEIP